MPELQIEMEILGIGPTEFLFIIIILLLVLGPSDLAQLGLKTGRLIRKLRASETWLIITNLGRTLRDLPNTLADEVGAEEILREVDPARLRPPAGSISTSGMKERLPPDAASQRVHPAEADAFSSWTTPAANHTAEKDDRPAEKQANSDEDEEKEAT